MKFYQWCLAGFLCLAFSYRVINFDLTTNEMRAETIVEHLKRDYLTSRGLLLLELSLSLTDTFKVSGELNRSLLKNLYRNVHGYDFRSKDFSLKVLSSFFRDDDQEFIDNILFDTFTLPNDVSILLNASTVNRNFHIKEDVYKFWLGRVYGHLALAESLVLAMKIHQVKFTDEYFMTLLRSVSSSDKSIICGYMDMYKLLECSRYE